jgi:hypothetical protein
MFKRDLKNPFSLFLLVESERSILITGPAKDASPAGDRKLAQSAQMYHYQV